MHIASAILNTLNQRGLLVDNLRGQCYDSKNQSILPLENYLHSPPDKKRYYETAYVRRISFATLLRRRISLQLFCTRQYIFRHFISIVVTFVNLLVVYTWRLSFELTISPFWIIVRAMFARMSPDWTGDILDELGLTLCLRKGGKKNSLRAAWTCNMLRWFLRAESGSVEREHRDIPYRHFIGRSAATVNCRCVGRANGLVHG